MATYKFIIGHYPSKIHPNLINRTGQTFGRLLVIGFAGMDVRRQALWHCLCECGNGITAVGGNLGSGNTTSCGCFIREKLSEITRTHGESNPSTVEYRTYASAKRRCQNPNAAGYSDYGGRGIEFRFDSYEDFLEDVGRRPSPQHSLDRKDNAGHYEKDNLQWSTRNEQGRNKRNNRIITALGMTLTLPEWVERSGIKRSTIRMRLTAGNWCPECAVSILPKQGSCTHRH